MLSWEDKKFQGAAEILKKFQEIPAAVIRKLMFLILI
jgi:hypothetical protein